ncbi:MAG: substrate-binding domain-containing protein [Candidatus Dormibacteria bacterium]
MSTTKRVRVLLRSGKRPVLATLTIATVALTLASCGSTTTPTPVSPKKTHLTVAISVPETTDPYFIAITDYFTREAQANGMTVLSANANGDIATQITQIETFVSEHVSAIAIDSINDSTIAPAIKAANTAGIPVFTIDTQPYASSMKALGASVVQTVETNNYTCGVVTTNEMLNWLNGRNAVVGRVILPLAQSTITRQNANLNTLKGHSNVKVVATVNGEASYSTALTATTQMLSGFPNITVVWGDNGPVGVGATRAIIGANLVGKVHVFANATVVPADQAIESGAVFVAGATQFPNIEAATVAYDLYQYLRGDHNVQKLMYTPCLPVTHANASKVTAYNAAEFTYKAPIQILKNGEIYQIGSKGALTKITLP